MLIENLIPAFLPGLVLSAPSAAGSHTGLTLAILLTLAGLAILLLHIQRQKRESASRLSPDNSKPTSLTEIQVFPASDVARRYKKEIRLSQSLGVLIVFLGCSIGYVLGLDPQLDPLVRYSFWAVSVLVGIAVAVWGSRGSRKERDLYLTTQGQEFIIAEEGLQCSIALLDIATAAALRRINQAYLYVPWTDIQQFTVLVGRGGRIYRLKLARYKQSVNVIRKHFAGVETELIELIRQHLSCPVTLKDNLL